MSDKFASRAVSDICKAMMKRGQDAELQRAYEQGVKDTLDKYDETCRIASDIRCAMGCKTAKECRDLISNGEIQRVKHGRWRHYEGTLTCSVCHTEIYDDIMELLGDDVPRYCPNCGVKMDGGEE